MQGLRRTPGRESDVLSYLVAETFHQFVYSCEEAAMKTCENGVVKSFEHVINHREWKLPICRFTFNICTHEPNQANFKADIQTKCA